jgi:hypothetical protein
MPRKITPERKKELEEKDELEALLELDPAIDQEIQDLTAQANAMLPGRADNFMDYGVVKTETDAKAHEIVDSVAHFYLTKESIESEPYIRQKNMVDKVTVSNLLFQMKTAEYAIIRLLEEMDNGSVHPRTFEVLAALQKSKMEIVKHLSTFMTIMEENYKKMKDDYRVKVTESPMLLPGEVTIDEGIQPTSSGGYVIRGTRSLMETMREAVPETRASGDLRKDPEENE